MNRHEADTIIDGIATSHSIVITDAFFENPEFPSSYDVVYQGVKHKVGNALFRGTHRGKKVIVKLFLDSKIRFKREKFVYTKGREMILDGSIFPKCIFFGDYPVQYLVMEYVQGDTLGQWWALDNFALGYMDRILLSLQDAHAKLRINDSMGNRHDQSFENFFKLDPSMKRSIKKYPVLKAHNAHFRSFKDKIVPMLYKMPKGFIIGDFFPVNIIVNSNRIVFLDMETISNSIILHDVATLYYSSVYSDDLSKLVYEKIDKHFDLSNKANTIAFNTFLCFHILERAKSLDDVIFGAQFQTLKKSLALLETLI